MNRQAKNVFIGSVIFLSVLAVLFLTSFVWGAATIRTSGGATSFTVADDTDNVFNISINYTSAVAGSNVTAIVIILNNTGNQLNITGAPPVHMNISIETGANDKNLTFSNTTTILNWTASAASFVLNFTSPSQQLVYVWFNATSFLPVKNGNITVNLYNATTFNSTSSFDQQINLTLNINDTFNVGFISGNPIINYPNMSQNYIFGALNISGNETGTSLNVTLSNGTGGGNIIRSNLSGNGVYGGATGFVFNFSGLSDGSYYLNVTANGTLLDRNESLTRVVVLDRTAPTVSLTSSGSTTSTTIVGTVSISDATSGALNSSSCSVDSSLAVVTESGASQTLTESGLSCGTSKTYVVTCLDTAGNLGSSVSTTLSTSSCGGSGGSGGSGGGGSGGTGLSPTYTWSDTIVADAVALEVAPVQNREVGNRQRVRVNLAGTDHHIGVQDLTAISARVVVTSDPQEKMMNVGDTWKVNVNGDNTNDLQVTLVSIANNKANLNIFAISEVIVAQQEQPVAQQQEQQQAAPTPKESNKAVWIVLVLVVLAAVVGFVLYKRKR